MKTLGVNFKYCEIPEDLVETVEEWREKLIEAVCETDDDLLERFLEDRYINYRWKNLWKPPGKLQ